MTKMQNVAIEVSVSLDRPKKEVLAAKRALKEQAAMDLIEELMENLPQNNHQEIRHTCNTLSNASINRDSRLKCRKRRSNSTILEFYPSPIKKSRSSKIRSLEPLQCLESITELESLLCPVPSSPPFDAPEAVSVSTLENGRPPTPEGTPGASSFEIPKPEILPNPWHFYSGDDEIEYAGGFSSYEEDVFLFRHSRELKFHPLLSLRNQPQVTPNMRSVLVDWIAKLNHHFKFCQETLFLAVNVLDRFLLTTPISRDCFQLLGITAFLIAAKQEEVTPPDLEELIRLCCNAFSTFQLKQLELIVLNKLHFDLFVPTSHYFFEHFCATRMRKAYFSGSSKEYTKLTRALGRYILELCLQNYSVCQHQPSLLACSVLELAHSYLHFVRLAESHHTQIYARGIVDKCILHVKQHTIDQIADEEMPGICEKYMTLNRH